MELVLYFLILIIIKSKNSFNNFEILLDYDGCILLHKNEGL